MSAKANGTSIFDTGYDLPLRYNLIMNKVSVSVTELASYISRRGNIAGGSYGSVSAVEGTRLHQRVFSDLKKAYGDIIVTEEALVYDYISESGLTLSVNGRYDAMMLKPGKTPMIFEIKSFNSTKESFDALVRPEHITQLKLYGAMYLLTNSDVLDVDLTLRYVSITTLDSFENTYQMSYEEAEKFWEDICAEYCTFAKTLLDYHNSLIDSASQIKFPFDTIRPGQKEFMSLICNSKFQKTLKYKRCFNISFTSKFEHDVK